MHQKVDFATCAKNTVKICAFSRFEGSWPAKLEPLGPESRTRETPGVAKVEVRAAKKPPGQVSQVYLSVGVMETAGPQAESDQVGGQSLSKRQVI